jgi:uncharacterized membrane protein
VAPLIVLVLVTLALRAAGLRVAALASWHAALRGGLAAMFTFTGVSHFVGMREDLIAMVPPALPNPGLLVTVTGLLEIAGAAGLLHRRTAPWAAGGLALLLLAMFPANVYAALEGLVIGGSPAMDLLPRTALQLLFLGAALAVLRPYLPGRRPSAGGAGETPRPAAVARVGG